ncbi:MAG TPA: cytochrome c [Blastocatellia bacterium]|nr:cytochrome c [Blastocatellia bacterium]
MKKVIPVAAACLFAAAFFAAAPSSASDGKRAVVFTKDVAPILQKRCEECHRQGGVAPMSLVTYEEARPWARAIKERVSRREMPPFHATGALGRYVGDPRLTDEEIGTISAWVDNGSPRGNVKDGPAPRQWKQDWVLGTPDIVVKAKRPYTVKASDKDQYVFFMFDYVFPEDTWISSIETRPGNARAVHHANTHLVPPMVKVPEEGYIAGDFDPTARGTIMVAGWAPGVTPVMLPEGTAVRIPKGLRLGIQIHYAPSAKETTDQTEVGIYLANGLVKKNLRVLFGDRKDIEIVPGDASQSFVAKNTFTTDAVIRFMHVHMHLRGKAMTMRLTYPDGRKEDVLEVPNYDFNWQRVYMLKEPLRVPKGTTVEYIGTYDNSAKNKFNPDPSKTVHWGEKTTDEMMQGRIFYEAADENLNVWVKKGRPVAASEAASKGQ